MEIKLDPDVEVHALALLRERPVFAAKYLVEEAGLSVRDAFDWIAEHSAAPTKPCPSCGKPLRTSLAKQCFECGADWHGE